MMSQGQSVSPNPALASLLALGRPFCSPEDCLICDGSSVIGTRCLF